MLRRSPARKAEGLVSYENMPIFVRFAKTFNQTEEPINWRPLTGHCDKIYDEKGKGSYSKCFY